MDTLHHEVIIIGAGPTGLALAAELHRLGSPTLILDRLPAGANTSRAAVLHSRTLEVLEPLGVTTELIANGLIVPTFQVRERNRILTSISFKDLETGYPYTLMCPQNVTEDILLRRLTALGGSVQRPCEVIRITPSEKEVEVQYRSGDLVKTVYTQWLVGCDGMHSLVREQAGIPFQGEAYEESFILADVDMEWALPRDEVNLFLSDQGLMLIAPLPSGHFRIVATMQHPPSELSLSDFQQILNERGPKEHPASIAGLAWSSRFHVHHRVACFLRNGRVLIAGDAAHVHSPAGGQGMNTGIQDSMSLACVLYGVLQDGIDSELDVWQERRLKIARAVVELTDRMTKVATVSSPSLQRLRNTALGIIGHIPYAQHAIAQKLSELGNH